MQWRPPRTAFNSERTLYKKLRLQLVSCFNSWALLIKRLSTTKHLSRKQIETLYQAVIRGKLNYACSIWSRSRHAHKVLTAEISGQRVCCGAIPGTSLQQIARESRLTSYETIILRADLRLYLAIKNRPLLSSIRIDMENFLDPLNETMEHTFLYSIGHRPFLHGFPTESFTAKDILAAYPPAKKRRSRRRFRNEVYLARFRMTVIPSRDWALQMRLADSDQCRHCLIVTESSSHLLQACPKLDRSSLAVFGPAPTIQGLSDVLYGPETFAFENALLLFITQNRLYKVFSDTPTTTPEENNRRHASISPSPHRAAKRHRPNQGSKRSRPASVSSIPEARRRLC